MKKYWKLGVAIAITILFFYWISPPPLDMSAYPTPEQVDSMTAVNYPLIMAEIDSIKKADSLLKLDSLKK